METIRTRQLEEEVVKLRRALRFYADPRRYHGVNQRIDGEPDEYQPQDQPYLLDVSRDGGRIAAKALLPL